MKFINDGKSFAKVSAVRKRIAEIKGELSDLQRAPLPAEEAKQRVRDWLANQQSDKGLAHHLFAWATSPDRTHDGPRGFEAWQIGGDHPPMDLMRELMRMLAVLAPDQIEQSAAAEIDRRLADGEPGLPKAERPARRAELERELFDLEVKEEAEIEKLEASGYLVHRRPEARPDIILGESA